MSELQSIQLQQPVNQMCITRQWQLKAILIDQSGSEDYRPQESYPKLSIHQFEEQVLSGDIAGKVLWSLYVTDEHDTHNIVNDYKTYDIACEMYRLLSRDKNPITKDWDIRIEQSFENIVNNKLQR